MPRGSISAAIPGRFVAVTIGVGIPSGAYSAVPCVPAFATCRARFSCCV
jgi:hypothetical protein